MANRYFLLRNALHRRTNPSSSLLQIPPFRPLLASPESLNPHSAAPISLRRGYYTAGFSTQRYPSSNGVENASTSRPRKKENNAGKNGYGFEKAKKPAFATNVYQVFKKPQGGDQAAKRSPEKEAAKWAPVIEAAKRSQEKVADKWSHEKEADKWLPEKEAAQRLPEKGRDEAGIEEMKIKLLALEKEVNILKENAIMVKGRQLRTEKRDGIAKARPLSVGNPQDDDEPVFTGAVGEVFKSLERKVPALTEVKPSLTEVEPSLKEVKLSEEALAMLERLREDGLLKGMCLCEDEKVMPERLQIASVQNRLRHVSEKFAVLHQEIAKLLSGSDLKNVALFGCPSMEKKAVNSAKKLRNFFRIQEDIVCGSCKLKSTCKFADRIVREDKLMLTDALRVLMAYSFYEIPPQIQIPSETEKSIAKLLKQIVNLSKEGSSV